MRYLFLSDVHLSVGRPEVGRCFIEFLQSADFKKADKAYILGDLFDYWIGPRHIELADYQDVLKTLQEVTKRGQEVFFIPGNRDFMVGKELTDATGVKVLKETASVSIRDQRIYLTHGDLLCTDDISYQSYRRVVRSGLVKSAVKHIPAGTGKTLARSLRGVSDYAVAQKPAPVRSLVTKTVKGVFRRGYDIIICGHIHEAGEQRFGEKMLYTLGDWSAAPVYLTCRDGVFGFNMS